jgi:hypothetical protein
LLDLRRKSIMWIMHVSATVGEQWGARFLCEFGMNPLRLDYAEMQCAWSQHVWSFSP